MDVHSTGTATSFSTYPLFFVLFSTLSSFMLVVLYLDQ